MSDHDDLKVQFTSQVSEKWSDEGSILFGDELKGFVQKEYLSPVGLFHTDTSNSQGKVYYVYNPTTGFVNGVELFIPALKKQPSFGFPSLPLELDLEFIWSRWIILKHSLDTPGYYVGYPGAYVFLELFGDLLDDLLGLVGPPKRFVSFEEFVSLQIDNILQSLKIS